MDTTGPLVVEDYEVEGMYFYTETEKHITKCSQNTCHFLSIPHTVQKVFGLPVKAWDSTSHSCCSGHKTQMTAGKTDFTEKQW